MQILSFFGPLLCLIFLICHPSIHVDGRPVENADDAKMYLQRYNYMGRENMETGELLTGDDFIAAISAFQNMANLTITGQLDDDTMTMMNMPRCGIPDNMGFSNKARRKRYEVMSKWSKTDLTWRINSNTPDLSNADTNTIMREALELWSNVSQLTFKETTATADIIIDFYKGDHGDGNPFDGPGGVLAHANFPIESFPGPSIAGDAHFDDDETFTQLTSQGFNLFQVAAHEFGHSLGLGHSDDPNALMYPYYRGFIDNFELSQDDINGIQYLYGENTNGDKPSAPPPGAPDSTMKPFNPDACPSQIDAMVTTGDRRTFAFIGDMVYQIDSNGVADGFPRRISDVFAGLPNNIDAGFYNPGNGRTYIFKGDQYWRFLSTTAEPGYPLPISNWGLPSDIDAAFIWSGNGRIYFTKGDQYYRFNTVTDRIDYGYPQPLSAWRLPVPKINAGVQWFNKRTYFFADGVYYRYNDQEVGADDGYPLPTAYWWFGCGGSKIEQLTTDHTTYGDESGANLSVGVPSTLAVLLSAALGLLHLI